MKYLVSRNGTSFNGEVMLSPSKTIGNKVLVFRVLKSAHISQHIASEQDDARILNHSMFSDGIKNKRGNVYKSIRYIRAVMSYFGGEWVLSTSDSIMGRSAQKVVKILHRYGLSICYEARTGRPPIKLIGKNVSGNVVRVDGMINSKMLEAKFIYPSTVLNENLEKQSALITSSGYIPMSIRAIQRLGVNTDWNPNEVLVEHEIIDGSELVVESDWSIASYIYQLVALSRRASLKVNGLNIDSIQSALTVKDIFAKFGVETEAFDGGVIIKRGGRTEKEFSHNFKHYPDLIPAVMVVCVCKKIPFAIYGGEELRKKEVDRIAALQTELLKLGAVVKSTSTERGEVLTFDGKSQVGKIREVEFETYNDQRIALALTLVSAMEIKVTIQNPEVVNKTYYNFWGDIKNLGFTVEE